MGVKGIKPQNRLFDLPLILERVILSEAIYGSKLCTWPTRFSSEFQNFHINVISLEERIREKIYVYRLRGIKKLLIIEELKYPMKDNLH